MTLPFAPPLEPMLAKLEKDIPAGDGWRYEPKWDGFRAIVFVDDEVHIGSRKGQPLQRYFPELLTPLREAVGGAAILDGEIIVASSSGLDFDSLQQRIHPAASRIAKLSVETPARFVAFDILAAAGKDLRSVPLGDRRQKLQDDLRLSERIAITPQSDSATVAARWFDAYEGAGLDGVIAKRHDQSYLPGDRGWVKVKHLRSVDCVVGGYRVDTSGKAIASLLLGLYDADGVFHHVGHTSSFSAAERRQLFAEFEKLQGSSFGSGRTPGAPSRWSGGKDLSWYPVRPERVCEVTFDYLQGNRFRHAARFIRWRLDKAPESCTYDQIANPDHFDLDQILREENA